MNLEGDRVKSHRIRAVNFRFIRRHTDGTEEVSDLEIGLDLAHVGQTIASAEPGKMWRITTINALADPPTIIAELVGEIAS